MVLVAAMMVGPSIVSAATTPESETPRLRRKQSIAVADIPRPGGVSYSRTHGHFLVAPEVAAAGSTAAPVKRVTSAPEMAPPTQREDAGFSTLPDLDDARAFAFDDHSRRLLVYDSRTDVLSAFPADEQGRLDLEHATRIEIPRAGLLTAAGLAVDPNGTVFILDRLTRRVLRWTPGAAAPQWIGLGALGTGELTGLAFDPARANLFVMDLDQKKIHEFSLVGELVTSHDVSTLGLHRPRSLVVAPSGDPTDAPDRQSLFIADAGIANGRAGSLVELAWAAPQVAIPPGLIINATLVRTTLTSQFSPPSPDPSGITYDSVRGRLLIVDGEVDEMTIFQGKNAWETTLTGTVLRSFDCTSFSIETVGAAFNRLNRHFFISDDDTRRVYEVNPGADLIPGTSDDTIRSFSTQAFGCVDPEGVGYDAPGKRLFIADGLGAEIWVVSAGPNGVVDGGGDDTITHFDTMVHGVDTPDAIEYSESGGTAFVLGNDGNNIWEFTPTGTVVSVIPVSNISLNAPAGITLGPSSTGSGRSAYIVNRGADNDGNPNENDGVMQEVAIGGTFPPPGGDPGDPPPPPGGPTVLNVAITTGSDDAEERPGGSMSLTGSDLELVDDSGIQVVGLRFPGVALPPTAMLTSAYIQFEADETQSVATALRVDAHRVANPGTFTSASANASSRPRTTAFVNWSPPAWSTVGEAGANQRTPSLIPIVEELMSLGWSSGNAMAFLVSGTGHRTARALEASTGAAPTLHLEFVINNPPTVDAGTNATITLPFGATLNGTVSDDGIPNPPAAFTTQWVKASGPGTVTFANANAIDTQATFSVDGTYFLRLTANDSRATASDSVRIVVNPIPPNVPPVVDAGPNRTITLPFPAALDGTISDDGLPNPPQTLTSRWSFGSGPGTVTFVNANSVDTQANFTLAGTYVLRLTAYDTEDSTTDSMTVIANPPPPNAPPVVDAGPDRVTALSASASLDGTITDDGRPNPPATTTRVWTKGSGPGDVTFVNALAIDTQASFTHEGVYILRLTANDNELSTTDSMQVTVTPAVFEKRIAAGSDDAEESTAGAIDLASSDLELLQETSGLQKVGLRFTGITIPAGRTIYNAWVQFTADEAQNVATTLTIRGHAFANAPTFSSTAKVSTRPATTAFATWSPAAWTTVGQSGPIQRTTDLTDVIQEIVSLPGWANNNAIALLVTGTGHRTARAFEAGAATAALLHIEYGTGPPPNAPPVVDAGPSGTITLPAGFALNGTVTDDGRPAVPGVVTTQWVKADGPGTVTFGNANAIDTQATFSLDGTYVLRLTASDSEATVSDSTIVTVNPPPVNQPPVVEAGTNATITLPFGAALDGTVTDDGLPLVPGAVTTAWTASGPGTVTFGNANAIDTQATFSLDGTYVLRLTANDGEYAPHDSVVITVNPVPPNVPPVIDAGPDRVVTLPSGAALDGTASDDGLPNPPQTFSTLWTKGSGPGTVTFANANAVDTQASFSLDGTYILRLTGNDTQATTYDSMTVTVNPAPPNSPPTVDAGPDRTVVFPASAALDGTVSDDGQPIPPGALTVQWTKGSGPGTVTFANANAIDTQASFGAVGSYILRLAAGDGQVTSQDSMKVTVTGVFEKRVAAGTDDVEESATGTMDLASSDLELLLETSGLQKVGLRFTGIAVPPNASIHDAWLQFVTDEVQNVATTLTIRGDAVANAPAFSSTAKVSTRAATTAFQEWSPPPWSTVGQAGPNQRALDLTNVIQEIVSQPGWASGNALALLVTGTGHRTARAFEQGAANGALLHIAYGTEPPVNAPPTVDAGANTAIALPAGLALDGTVSDDGRPIPPGALSTQWVKASGPGTVTFGNANATDTQANFTLDGTYVLRLTANDGEFAVADSVEVTVAPAGPDTPPVVDAGPDRSVVLPASAALDGTVSDDGQPIPPGALTVQWTKGSGPGTVTFANANAIDTQASFGAGGSYVLRLTASDGATTVYDSMQVTVAAVVEKRIAAGADDAEESNTGTIDLASSDLELVEDTIVQSVGLRYTAIPVPPGAIIVNAWVQFVTDEVQSVATTLTIRGQAIANAPAFSSTNKISTRTGTGASAVWTPAAWTTNGQAGANQRTTDLTGVIQAIVNTPGWATNNALVLLITGTGHRTARAFEQGAANSPLLHIEYR